MLKDAPIIIFDEATANVDPENEDKLQKAMEAQMCIRDRWMRFLYDRHDDFVLLLSRSDGTRYANFQHDWVAVSSTHLDVYKRQVGRRGYDR